MSTERIAIIGLGLRYPDAGSPDELWENVLQGRRAFRRLPDERMNHADYYSADPAAPDRFYSATAAVLRDYEFDRVGFSVAGSTYRSTDLTHWLALDVAAAALADAGFPGGEGLPRRATGVVLGNTLTGEFSRANVMRLRWPYVRRTLAAALAERGWGDDDTASFLRDLEPRYKAAFPPINEDTLAGGLANTIAGRVCNHFDLAGGGFTVDGACSSSLLSVATAARSLADGDLDVVLAGGVDLSIDPFEVIGFAKTGALATGEMKVYDRGSSGFWPGEGCGLVVLMREEDAIARGKRIYATVTGWGISSDGKGGITRPEASGHRLALSRAYARAGYGVETVSYFEGHGTGTALGDATEIDALSAARRAADPAARPAALSTVKGNIGHTKAAAGVAGLIKATLAVHHQVIPPATGHYDPHPKLTADDAALYVPDRAELFPGEVKVRAGVSAMGFGGINTHIALEQPSGSARRGELGARVTGLVAGRQDAELLLLDADDHAGLRDRAVELAGLVSRLAQAELADLAGELAGRLAGRAVRASVVARRPAEAQAALTALAERIDAGERTVFAPRDGVFLGDGRQPPRIVYLFPGQGSGRGAVGAIRHRFPVAEDAFATAGVPTGGDQVATEVAQPRIVAGSLAGVRVLRSLGVDADAAVGHSLGELSALAWGGAMSGRQLLHLARTRGQVMAKASRGGGAMAGVAAPPERVRELMNGHSVVIAGYNGPAQTVIAGEAGEVDSVCERAKAEGVHSSRVNVSHAFHSPLVRPAADGMAERLAEFGFAPLTRTVYSTVTGAPLDADTDLRTLLRDQVLRPVRFHEAAARAVEGADLVVEVGPGRVLTGLLADIAPQAGVLPLDTDSASLVPLLTVVAAAHALGTEVDTDALLAGRVLRPLPLDGSFTFLASPCETAPELTAGQQVLDEAEAVGVPAAQASADEPGVSTLELLRRLAAERVELPLESVDAATHPLDDLHLSSITVGQIVNDVTRELGRPALEATTGFATVSLGELAGMIDELAGTARDDDGEGREVPGVAPWVRAFRVDLDPEPAPVTTLGTGPVGSWSVHAPTGFPLAERLRVGLEEAGIGDGVLLCLPDDGEEHVALFLAAAKDVLGRPAATRFAVVQHRLGAAGLARTLHLEHPGTPTTVVGLADLTTDTAEAVDEVVRRVLNEVALTTGYSEVHYTADGERTTPVLRAIAPAAPEGSAASPLDDTDVLLVTGGGKGITAECALAMAQDSGATLVLVGRADPATDEELSGNLARMTAAGVRHRYLRADVTSADRMRDLVALVHAEIGPVTAVLHGAGRNEPAALASLTEDAFRGTLAPKIDGLRAVLAAVDQDRIKLLVTFGSIIGRAGLRGEAHYATANDWMSELTVRFGQEHPAARVLALEWSVWSGAGMGERLGVVEALTRDGITPISTENGIAVLRRVLADPGAGPVLVVSGRAAGLPTLTFPEADLPLDRFVDQVVVHYPGIELITEAELSAGADPYLADHLLEGDFLFPAVLGMEAMTQVAAALTGEQGAPLMEDVEFLRPIVVRPGQATTIRLAAQVRDAGTVDVVIRSAETGFAADHFRAALRLPRPDVRATDGPAAPGTSPTTPVPHSPAAAPCLPGVPVDPGAELYGDVLFQGKRFQRLLAYRTAAARHAVAELATASPTPWFAAFLPQRLLLADPGTRDAVMHAIQCCVPDATLLPEGIERLHLAQRGAQDADYVVMDARERVQDGDSYTYDVDVFDPAGVLVERWEGLRLRAVRKKSGAGPWVPSLLGSYVERAVERVLGGRRAVVVEPDPAHGDPADRREWTALAVGRALGGPVAVRYRPDGRPETDGALISASHGAGVTLAVAGGHRLGCDVQAVEERDERDWAGLLGTAQLPVRDLVAAEAGESAAAAGTRVWSALECLRKAGATSQALTLDRVHEDGWVVLSAGDARVATWVTTLKDLAEPVVFAVLSGQES